METFAQRVKRMGNGVKVSHYVGRNYIDEIRDIFEGGKDKGIIDVLNDYHLHLGFWHSPQERMYVAIEQMLADGVFYAFRYVTFDEHGNVPGAPEYCGEVSGKDLVLYECMDKLRQGFEPFMPPLYSR